MSGTSARTPQKQAGFTLLEVMVAVAILSVSLTAIFASQGTAIKVAHRARKTTVAVLLARCKMGEIEEEILENGFPAVELADEDACCEDAEVDGFRCDWIVERVELPEPGLEDDGAEKDGDAITSGGGEGESTEDALSNLTGGAGSVQDALAGMGGGSGDMVSELAMSYAYPILRPAIEEQIRRAKIQVIWTEGSRERSFVVTQYLIGSPPPAAPDPP